MYKLVQMYLSSTAKGRPGTKIKPKGLVIHWTANTNQGADAQAHRNYFNNSGVAASTHYIVDDKYVIQCLPENEMAYHVGAQKYSRRAVTELSSYPNDTTLGIEICVNKDADFKITMKNTILLAADICKKYGWTRNNLWRHHDITGKDCPKFFVENAAAVNYGFSSAVTGWEEFMAGVENTIKKETKKVPQWKQDIMEQAQEEGLINGDHDPDEAAPKWFVLAVALNGLKKNEE